MQLMVLANILAQEVFPTPRGPQNKKACAKWLLLMAFFRVLVIDCWPTTVSKVAGRYLRAETTKFSIYFIWENKYNIMFGMAVNKLLGVVVLKYNLKANHNLQFSLPHWNEVVLIYVIFERFLDLVLLLKTILCLCEKLF